MKGEPVLKRFEDKYIPEPMSGCWLWTAAHAGEKYGGHGTFVFSKKNRMGAHRASWLLFRGAIPDGMQVLHTCDVGACVNPNHLFLGTQIDNMADMKAKGRGRGLQGSAHGNSKLTEDQVREIRRLHAERKTYKEIGRLFGIGKSMIGYIVTRHNWAHVQ